MSRTTRRPGAPEGGGVIERGEHDAQLRPGERGGLAGNDGEDLAEVTPCLDQARAPG